MSWPKKTSMLQSVNRVKGMPKSARLAMAGGRMPNMDMEGNLAKPPRSGGLPGAKGGMMARMRARRSSKQGMSPKAMGGKGGGQQSYSEC